MTQIVYDGQRLFADRKLYSEGRFAGHGIKLRSHTNAIATLHYAFAGSMADCAIGERVVESNFDPEVCNWAVQRIGHENLRDAFFGILVEVPHDSKAHRVYLINYAGDKCECVPGQLLVVGLYEQVVRDTHSVLTRFADKIFSLADVLRIALRGTSQDQDGYIIDCVTLEDGKHEEM